MTITSRHSAQTAAAVAAAVMGLTLALAWPTAGIADGGFPQVKAKPGPSLIASYTPQPHAKVSGLVLDVHVDRPVGTLSRVRIDGILADTTDRHHLHQFWFVGTKQNGLPAGHFKVHRNYMVTFKLCTKAGHCLTTSKSVYVHRL